MYKDVLIISDNFYLCKGFLEIIERKKIPNCFFTFSISSFSNKEDFNVLNHDIKVFDLKKQKHIDYIKNNYDLIFSIHCKQIFPVELTNHLKCINIHPGFNPINRGWYPQVFSIIKKMPIGATIHEIDDKLDHGPIIERGLITKNNFDTSETLYNKILEKELKLLENNIENIINNNYNVIEPEDEGTLHLKRDFNELLELNLKEQVLVGDLIDRLRALTHGDFKNAYFIDPDTGKKIFVSIKLNPEDHE
ncbi:dTDP-4-amino-4,6-dideoxyglucose formyltransferase [Flavobacterium sp. XS2P39]|uniref:dTDP-4-amino-4,6-dideoxyglucose formyltransferase n=1 Tax=Flavobacterium sp. XS2P39 TaxID=3401725 RepID=UPI003AAE456A